MIRFTRGNLKEESHYYPFGLPMGDMGSAAVGFTPNRRKYQGNEYIQDAGLNWMDFNARQYDPQIGRFLSVDPLAASGGQERLSPYVGMGDNPVQNIDPAGLRFGPPKVVPFWNVGLGGLESEWEGPGSIGDWYRSLSTALYNAAINGANEAAMKAFKEAQSKSIEETTGEANKDAKGNGGNTNYKSGQDGGELPEVVVHGNKPRGFFKKAMAWLMGLKFHFSMEGDVTYGAQIGVTGKLNSKEIGGELNLASVELVSGKTDVTTDAFGFSTGTVEGNYVNKGGKMHVQQGAKAGLGVVGVSVERSFDSGSKPNDQVKIEGNYGIISTEHVIPISQDAMIKNTNAGLHLDLSVGLKVLIGVDLRVQLGFTHD